MEHRLFPFEKLRVECERDGKAKRIIRCVFDDNRKARTQAESISTKVSGFLTVGNGMFYNGTRPYILPNMRNLVIEQARDTHPCVQATKS